MNNSNDDKTHHFIELSIVLAIATGFLYMLGYSYFEGFYSYLGIPMAVVEVAHETILLYGSNILFFSILILALLMMIYHTIRSIVLEFKSSKFVSFLLKGSSEFFSPFMLGLFLILLVILVFILGRWFNSLGNEGAKRFIDNSVVYNVSHKTTNDKFISEKLCLVSISKEAFVFVDPWITITSIPRVVIVPKESVISLTSMGKIPKLPTAVP